MKVRRNNTGQQVLISDDNLEILFVLGKTINSSTLSVLSQDELFGRSIYDKH